MCTHTPQCDSTLLRTAALYFVDVVAVCIAVKAPPTANAKNGRITFFSDDGCFDETLLTMLQV